MKKLFALLTLCTAFATLTSCELKHDDINMDQIFLTDLYGKWNIGDDYGYSTIEFTTEGYYFMEEKSSYKVVWGKYSKTSGEDYQITLSDGVSENNFGVIDITDYGDDYLNYELTIDGSSTSYQQRTSLEGDVNETISDNTSLLSTIWGISEYFYTYTGETLWCNSEEVEIGSINITQNRETDVKYVYFSALANASDQATFIVIDVNGTATSYQWGWLDDNEEEIVISGWRLEDVDQFTIDKLTSSAAVLNFEATFEVETVEVMDNSGIVTVDKVVDVEDVSTIYQPTYLEDEYGNVTNQLDPDYVPELTETFTLSLSQTSKIYF